MMDIIIKRISFGSWGTFGVMMDDDTQQPLFVTVERPWLNNQHKVSCIPPGQYVCRRIDSPKHGDCFEVMNVPDRDMIEIHSANLAEQLEGCIAPGMQFGEVNGTPAVMNSKQAVASFMAMQQGLNEFNLRIIEVK
jgi:hypothetical protein